jgi:hypothetical protein
MTLDANTLYNLLPAIYRLRDVEQGAPLLELLAVIGEQFAIVQEGIEQAYDDTFIETCAEWVVPYIGDLIGVRTLHGQTTTTFSQRAEVANTLAYRRRKGTLAVLEQLAHDVTNYPAVAVEFFRLLATTQYMNHLRPENIVAVDLRQRTLLDSIGTPFERSARTLEVRRIASGRGRYNIPNVGLFLFRLAAYPLTQANAKRFTPGDGFRYLVNPLGINTPLFNHPQTEETVTQFAGPINVPISISRLAMEQDKDLFYGVNASISLNIAAQPIPSSEVVVCNLSDKGDGTDAWAHAPADNYGIDPELGRLVLPTNKPVPPPDAVLVSFYYGFSDAIGGGEYERPSTPAQVVLRRVSAGSGLQDALNAVPGGGVEAIEGRTYGRKDPLDTEPTSVVEITDSRTYSLASAVPNLRVAAGQHVEIHAENGHRPFIELQGGAFTIDVGEDSRVVLSGLVITGGAVRIIGQQTAIELIDCTLVPGISRSRAGEPEQPRAPSLIIEPDNVRVFIRRSIVGGLRIANGSEALIEHSIVDATADDELAYAAPTGETDPGGALTIENATVIGRVYTLLMGQVSNCIFTARAPQATPGGLPIRVEQTQAGCVRFSYLPPNARVPRRYQCQPASGTDEAQVRPRFTSLRYGVPGYCQLSQSCPPEIRRGADDESEMGVFHDLFHPQRETNLRVRLDEYLRVALEAGILYAT